MKASRILSVVVVLMALYGGWHMLTHREKTFSDAAAKGVEAQVAEKEQCKQRLASFHKAWSDFKRDNKGSEARTADALIPKYIKDPMTLVCPTADRWIKRGKAMQAGGFEYKGKSYSMTYGFMWTSASGPFLVKRYGEKAPLAQCTAHQEALYRAGYNKLMPMGAFSEENRPKLISEVAKARVLAVLRNGTIEERDPSLD